MSAWNVFFGLGQILFPFGLQVRSLGAFERGRVNLDAASLVFEGLQQKFGELRGIHGALPMSLKKGEI